MGDVVGRDKINQSGYNPKLIIDNRSRKPEGFWKAVWVAVIGGLTIASLVGLWNFFF